MNTIDQLAAVNPFRLKVELYPGQIFNRPIDDAAQIRQLVTNGKETFLEFGSGSGQHLIEQAARKSDSNFIGFEIRYKRSVRTIEKADVRNVKNIYIVRGMSDFASTLIPDNSISGLWVNFPDPWEKPTRQKHRILNLRSLEIIHRKLKTDGFLAFKTDHSEMFESTLEAVMSLGIFSVLEVSRDLHQEPRLLEKNVMTEFEGLFCSQGLPVNYFLLTKRP
jgi:tRNA (guanine-N7-)-methyltransferase